MKTTPRRWREWWWWWRWQKRTIEVKYEKRKQRIRKAIKFIAGFSFVVSYFSVNFLLISTLKPQFFNSNKRKKKNPSQFKDYLYHFLLCPIPLIPFIRIIFFYTAILGTSFATAIHPRNKKKMKKYKPFRVYFQCFISFISLIPTAPRVTSSSRRRRLSS